MVEMTEGRKHQLAESVIHKVIHDLDFSDIADNIEEHRFVPVSRNDMLDIARLVWNADIDVVLRTDD